MNRSTKSLAARFPMTLKSTATNLVCRQDKTAQLVRSAYLAFFSGTTSESRVRDRDQEGTDSLTKYLPLQFRACRSSQPFVGTLDS